MKQGNKIRIVSLFFYSHFPFFFRFPFLFFLFFPKIKNFQNFYISFFFVFFPKFKKLNISLIYKAIIIIFSVSLPMVNFNPTTLRTLRTTSRWRSTQKVWASQNSIKKQNDQKGQYTLAHFWEKLKKI